MRGDYPDDTFTQTDVERELDQKGLKHFDKGRYILAQCPTHEDKHPSVQIYKDDWFVNCHATCGRYHITKAFPELRNDRGQERSGSYSSNQQRPSGVEKVSQREYKTYDLMDYWKELPKIPADHVFKGIPIETLNDLGWRWVKEHNQYFIPYFSASQESIPFAQYRNLGDGPRFIFLKDAKPTAYGTWNLDNSKLFVCEGASDAAVLDYCAVPWIAMPSAASVELIKKLASYCAENDVELVYAGDNDAAGDKLRAALDEVTSYRVKQPPTKYKDWGDFLEAEGQEAVSNYCFEELFGKKIEVEPEPEPEPVSEEVENVLKIFPGAEVLNIESAPNESKELSSTDSTVSF